MRHRFFRLRHLPYIALVEWLEPNGTVLVPCVRCLRERSDEIHFRRPRVHPRRPRRKATA